jgi:hypothetical protein
MSVIHKKETNKVAELEAQISKLKEEIKKRDEEMDKQITDAQLALCEIFESVVNMNG